DGIGLEDLTAQEAGGKVQFGGWGEINGFALGQLSLTATGERMEFRYPEGFRSTVDAQLDLVGTMAAPTLRGTVTVKNALYDKRIDISPGLIELAGGRSSGPAPAPAPGPGLPVRFDVRIQAPSSLRVENNMAHIVSSADLVLRGTYEHPLLFGGADVERGEVFFEGHRYMVRRGRIEFSNPTKIEPFFDLSGETLVRVPGQTYVVNVQLVGTVNGLGSSITSDPPLSQVEILSLLFGGDTASAQARDAELRTLQREESQRSLATSRLQQAAVGVVAAPFTRAVEQTFGLDTFQITPNVGYDPYQRLNPTARLTVGKRISNKVYLTFSRSLNTPGGADQVILLEYDQNDRLSWIFSRNEDGTYALDVRVRHVF
ncbi:MAG TPA: translocation/assembly module TamB domain-containing protein, partial [Vicinamibacterales bacterium]